MNDLHSEKLFLENELNQLASEISKKQVDLSNINKDIQIAREELIKVRELHGPSIGSYKKQIDELTRDIQRLHQEKELVEEYIDKKKAEGKKEIDILDSIIKEREKTIGALSLEIDAKQKEIRNLQNNKEIADSEYKKSLERLHEFSNLNSEFVYIQKQILDKKQELKEEQSKIDQIKEREDNINKFAQQLAREKDDLDYRLRGVAIMEERLTPEYIETFKQYVNL